jgi:hypothetical protein
VGSHGYDIDALHQFAKAASDPVPLDGGSVLLGHGEADPDRAVIIAKPALYDEGRAVHPRPDGRGEKVRPLPQPIHDEISGKEARSGAEALATTRATRSQNFAAANGRQASAEAVTALAHQFTGLISPLHG